MKTIKNIVVRRKPGKHPAKGLLWFEGRVIECLLGKNGITTRKFEGDMKSPAGRFSLLYGYVRKNYSNGSVSFLKLKQISQIDAWCDAPGSANYNRPVKLPFGLSHEKMYREDRLYDVVIVMDYNVSQRVRNRGSAVFFHLSAGKPYTAGCVAISKLAMRYLLPRLSKNTTLRILA
jgi:L,D-peptidoglycan transpeptidase YkuD (ErfK/YbiS/YcfS/YnhG family)